MSGVVLRCPTCGTTQSHLGECDACSDGEVRYFCGNHNPGLWLDGPLCKACGAKFGEAPRIPPKPPRATPTLPAGDRRRPDPRPTPLGGEPPRAGTRRPPPRVEDVEDKPPLTSLEDLLARISEEGDGIRYRVEEAPRAEPTVEAPVGSFPVVGCLVRVVLFVLLLIALGIGGLFFMIGGIY